MNKRRYYCMLGKPAMAAIIPVLLEHAEKQGWVAEHVMFCGIIPVSSLDIKRQTATPMYTIIFSKWGEIDKAPVLPNMEFGKKPDDTVPVTEGKILDFPAREKTDAEDRR